MLKGMFSHRWAHSRAEAEEGEVVTAMDKRMSAAAQAHVDAVSRDYIVNPRMSK